MAYKRSAGRPRSESSRQAILASVIELLDTSSVRDVSIEAVAKRAGVGKVTIYRWWPTKTRLVIDAFVEFMTPNTSNPKKGSCFADLTDHFRTVAQEYNGRIGQIIAQIIGEGQFDKDSLHYFLEKAISERRKFAAETIEMAKATNEIRSDIDTDVIIDALYGPLYFRLLVDPRPADEAFADQLIRMVTAVVMPHSRTTLAD